MVVSHQQSKRVPFLTVINYVHLLHHVPSTFKEFVDATSGTENLGSTEKLPWPMIGRSRDLVTVRVPSTVSMDRRKIDWPFFPDDSWHGSLEFAGFLEYYENLSTCSKCGSLNDHEDSSLEPTGICACWDLPLAYHYYHLPPIIPTYVHEWWCLTWNTLSLPRTVGHTSDWPITPYESYSETGSLTKSSSRE